MPNALREQLNLSHQRPEMTRSVHPPDPAAEVPNEKRLSEAAAQFRSPWQDLPLTELSGRRQALLAEIEGLEARRDRWPRNLLGTVAWDVRCIARRLKGFQDYLVVLPCRSGQSARQDLTGGAAAAAATLFPRSNRPHRRGSARRPLRR